jgi:dTDP-4-amino-4,6-dideoxygalactose transaminase
MSTLTIPFFGIKRQYNNLRTEILDVTDEVLRSGQVMSSNYTAEFENWLARKNHVKYAITCHSGTQALEIMASYFLQDIETQVGNQPRIAMGAVTYSASANAWMRSGWNVEFLDVNKYGVMNPSQINLANPPDAVLMIGIYGAAVENPFGSRGWVERLRLKSTIVIEDAAQHWLSADCQRMGLASAISFDPTKNFNNYGNGGAIVTDSSDLMHYAREIRNNGKPGNALLGTNSRMSEVDCAQMMIKSRHIDNWQQRRRDIASHWITRLKNTGIRSLIDIGNFDTHCYHKFVIELDDRDGLRRHLASQGIDTRIHYEQPLHEISAFRQCQGPGILATASALCRRVLSLPIYPELSDLEVEYIIDRVLDFSAQERN